MDSYIIALHETGQLERLLTVLKERAAEEPPGGLPCPESYITSVTVDGACPVHEESLSDCNENSQIVWHKLHEVCVDTVKGRDAGPPTTSPTSSQSDVKFPAAEKLHEIADTLPSHGCGVEVVISLTDSTVQSLPSESSVMLYGCLKRLRTWHNAVIRLVTTETCAEINPLLRWRNYLQAEVLGTLEEVTLPSNCSLWRGQAVVLDSRKTPLLCLRDMCLEFSLQDREEDRMETDDLGVRLVSEVNQRQESYLKSRQLSDLSLSQTMEILEEVDVVTVPSFLLTPCCLSLKQNGSTSMNEFLEHVDDNNEVGYVLRVGYLKRTHVKACGEGIRSTKNWKEAVSANTAAIYDVVESEEDMDGYLHLLLTSGPKSTDVSPGVESAQPSGCTAYVMRSAEEINGGIIDMLHRHWLRNAPPTETGCCVDVRSVLPTLPVWDVSDLSRMRACIVRTQRDVLQAWLDERRCRGEPVCMTEGELLSVLEAVHRHVLGEAERVRREEGVTPSHQPYTLWGYTREPSDDWPERQALKLQENCSRQMTRFMSSESLQQSSPIQPADGGEKSVDVGDFLKLFRPDGSAARDNLCLLQAKEGGSLLSKISSFDDREISWPESKDVKFHDIYYNNGRRCEKLEMEYCKLRQRQLGSETRCTVSANSSGVLDHSCSSIKSKALKKIPRSPVRRSPRKHAPPRDRMAAAGVGRDKRRIELCPKVSKASKPKDPDVVKKPPSEPLSQLSVDKQTQPPLGGKPKSGGSRQVPKEDVPPSEAGDKDKADKKKSSRSDRHKRRLLQIVHDVLKAKGVRSGDELYKACSTKLYTVTKIYAMELPTSRNLVADMTKIAEGQVQQVIDLEMMKKKSTSQGK